MGWGGRGGKGSGGEKETDGAVVGASKCVEVSPGEDDGSTRLFVRTI